jgi:Mrp family chromosome partitioning ATPase/capsular polysaccharide biosynthesis protein
MQSGATANAMRLSDYFTLLRRHWLAILLCLLLGLGGAVAYMEWAPKEYRATTSVLVTAVDGNTTQTGPNAINLDTEAQLVTGTETIGLAAKALKLSESDARGLGDNVSVSVPPNTNILDITYTGSTADEAQRGSLAFAQAYLDQRTNTAQADIDRSIKTLNDREKAYTDQLSAATKSAASLAPGTGDRARVDQQIQQLSQQLAVIANSKTRLSTTPLSPGQIVTQPRLPSSPSSPNLLITLAAGLVIGLLLGVGLAALRERADDRIRRPEDLYRRTRVPVATVLSTKLNQGEVAVLPPLTADGRGYARLRNLVTTSLEESSRRVVLVAGVRRGGGSVAANLAASLARAGEEVFLLCADVFNDTASALLADPPNAGIAEVLAGEKHVDSVSRRLANIPSLRIMGPGRDPDRADALLQTRSPRKLVDQLLQTSTYVVIEAPPTTDSPDAQTLANVAEIAVLVVEAGETSAREVLDACAQLESMHTAVLGAVIARYGDADSVKDDGKAGKGKQGAKKAEVTAADGDAPARVEPMANTRPVPTTNGVGLNGTAANGAVQNGTANGAANGAVTNGARPGRGDATGGQDESVAESADASLTPPGSRGPLTR